MHEHDWERYLADSERRREERERWRKEQIGHKYCMACHADLTEYLHELDELKPDEPYGITCRECGAFVEPLDGDDLPHGLGG